MSAQNLRLVRLPELLNLVPLSKASIYRLVKAGTFPAPVRIGAHAVAWRWSDLEQWLNKCQQGGAA